MAREAQYRRVVHGILDQIRDGRLQPGARLPTTDQLTETYEVPRSSVREAVIALWWGGFIDTRHGEERTVRRGARQRLARWDTRHARRQPDS